MIYTGILKMEDILEASDCDGEATSNARLQFAERLQDYRKAFAVFDKDENNTILCSDLKNVLQYLDKDPTDADVEDMLNSVIRRRNEKDSLDFEEFVEAMEHEKAMTTESLVREAFTLMDPDANGYVTLANIKHVIANLGFDFTEEEIQYMIDEADPNETGRIEYEGLIRLISGDNETLAKAYQKRMEQDRHLARRREAERATFMASASKTDRGSGDVPDFAELASQFDHGHYDKYSRKASRHRPSASRPVRKPAVTRTRLAYLQRQDKAIGAACNADTYPTGDIVTHNSLSPEFRTGSVTDIRTPRGLQYINSAPKDDRGYQDAKYLNPVKVTKNVDHRLLEPSYYLKKTKDSNKNNSMHVGHVHSMTDELQQELRRIRNTRVSSNDGTPRSISVLTKPSSTNNTTPLSFTDEQKRYRISKTPQLTYTQRAAAREEVMNNKLYTSLWRSAFANALEKLQINNTKGMMGLSTPDPLGERLQPTPLEDSNRLNINRAEKLNQRVSVISPFLDAPAKNTVQEAHAFKRFINGPNNNKLRRTQVPVFQHEKYHKDFLRPNILPKIEPKPKHRDAITKSDLHRVINSINL